MPTFVGWHANKVGVTAFDRTQATALRRGFNLHQQPSGIKLMHHMWLRNYETWKSIMHIAKHQASLSCMQSSQPISLAIASFAYRLIHFLILSSIFHTEPIAITLSQSFRLQPLFRMQDEFQLKVLDEALLYYVDAMARRVTSIMVNVSMLAKNAPVVVLSTDIKWPFSQDLRSQLSAFSSREQTVQISLHSRLIFRPAKACKAC